jgi:hypothetical protein
MLLKKLTLSNFLEMFLRFQSSLNIEQRLTFVVWQDNSICYDIIFITQYLSDSELAAQNVHLFSMTQFKETPLKFVRMTDQDMFTRNLITIWCSSEPITSVHIFRSFPQPIFLAKYIFFCSK